MFCCMFGGESVFVWHLQCVSSVNNSELYFLMEFDLFYDVMANQETN